jgi:hypothetical protein
MNYVVISKTPGFHGPEFFETVEQASSRAALLNSKMRPEHQDFVVYALVQVFS